MRFVVTGVDRQHNLTACGAELRRRVDRRERAGTIACCVHDDRGAFREAGNVGTVCGAHKGRALLRETPRRIAIGAHGAGFGAGGWGMFPFVKYPRTNAMASIAARRKACQCPTRPTAMGRPM